MLAAQSDIDFGLLASVVLGTGLVMASACVFNNILDIKIDSRMTRTLKRALVTGAISVKKALTFGALLGILGFITLLFFVNFTAYILGVIAFMQYVFIYGYFKRRTVHGTLLGSFAGALPPLAGYTAVTNHLDLACLLLFASLVFWQMAHFYSIAIFRLKEYKTANLPMLPIVKGIGRTKKEISFYIIVFLLNCFLFYFLNYAGFLFLVPITCLTIIWFYSSIQGFNTLNNIIWSVSMFKKSLIILLAFSLFLSLDSLI